VDRILLVITGPTGIGKSKVALEIARHFNTEIISADSRQIYKETKIGTAVPEETELKKIRHHFIRSHSISDYYNASQYEFDVLKLLEELFQKNNLVVMVGGSMLYVDAVCNGIDDLPAVDPELRKSLLETYHSEGIDNLRLQLKKLDPDYYASVDLKNPKRIIHALEICLMTGKPYSSFRSESKKTRPFGIIKIGLNCDRQELYDRIDKRVDKMVLDGLVDEAQSVYPYRHLNALNTVGYKELFEVFDGKASLEEAIARIKNNTHKYARKQLTWFRRDKGIRWFEPGQAEKIIHYITAKTARDGG
jgi:tRNA dimethylallyltransferase